MLYNNNVKRKPQTGGRKENTMNTRMIIIIDDEDNSIVDAFPYYLPFGKVTKKLVRELTGHFVGNDMDELPMIVDWSYGIYDENGNRIANFYKFACRAFVDAYKVGRFINGLPEAEYDRLYAQPRSGRRNNRRKNIIHV